MTFTHLFLAVFALFFRLDPQVPAFVEVLNDLGAMFDVGFRDRTMCGHSVHWSHALLQLLVDNRTELTILYLKTIIY